VAGNQMQRQTISVALCTYNGQRFVAQQLASLAKQTRAPDELIICDDGSTDQTLQIIHDFIRSAPFPVELHRHSKNLGSTGNFEKAIRACHGDLIALCDQDDYWLPEKLATLEAYLVKNPGAGLAFSDAQLVDLDLVETRTRLRESTLFTRDLERRLVSGDAIQVMLQRKVVTGATVLFRAEFRDSFLPIPASWVHDGWIAFIIALFSELTYVDQPLIQYRQHSDQQIGAVDRSLRTLLRRRPRLNRAEFQKQWEQTLDLGEFLGRLSFPNSDTVRSQVVKKASHLKSRAEMPGRRLSRIPVILSQYPAYRLYAQGWKSAFRDLLAEDHP
jgi:glycosyltransferase involved in cell wall biosynthesis